MLELGLARGIECVHRDRGRILDRQRSARSLEKEGALLAGARSWRPQRG
jgi:hypothetical protein